MMKSILLAAMLGMTTLLSAQTWTTGWNTIGLTDAGTAIKYDGNGHYYATGQINYLAGTFDTLTNGGFLAKFRTDGTLVWARQAGSYCSSLDFDPSGNICIAGEYSHISFIGDTLPPITGGINTDIYAAKFDTAGNRLWVATAGGNLGEAANGVEADVYGNTYFTGNFTDTAFFGNDTLISRGGQNTGDIFIAKIDSAGNYVWAVSAGGSGDFETGNGISSDGSGQIYVTGSFRDTAFFDTMMKISSGLGDIFTAKYDSSGVPLWVATDGVDFNIDDGNAIVTDNLGSSYVTGKWNNLAYVSKYSTFGSREWFMPSQTGILQGGEGIALDTAGNVYLTGYFQQSISFDGVITLPSIGEEDVFVAAFTNGGNFLWLKTGGGTDYDRGQGICVDDSGSVVTTGWFRAISDFDGVHLVALDSIYQSAFFIKTGSVSTNVAELKDADVKLYPNPAQEILRIEGVEGEVMINDLAGRCVRTFSVAEDDNAVDVSTLGKGMYIIRLSDGRVGRFVKE